jgi:hypothetical protein
VWNAATRRWVISDPTFDGYWTRGRTGPPLSAADLSALGRRHVLGQVWFHGSSGSARPSRYYVDPTYLCGMTAVEAFAGGTPVYLVEGAAAGLAGAPVARVANGIDLDRQPPLTEVAATSPRVEVAAAALPPPFAAQELATRTVDGPSGRTTFTLPAVAGVAGVTAPGRWETLSYAFARSGGVAVTPVMPSVQDLVVRWHGLAAPAQIHVWAVRTFPRSREIVR